MNEDKELKHYGVKGMKWGIRRYQNTDGSLTAAGKKRYAKNRELKLDNFDLKTSNVMNRTKEKVPINAVLLRNIQRLRCES